MRVSPKKEEKVVEVVYDGETFNVTYNKRGRTLGLLNLVREDAGSKEAIYRQVEDLILAWELEDEKGKPYPRTRGALDKLDMELVVAILNRIWEDQVPNPPSSESSSSFT